MCIIAAKPAGVKMPSRDTIRSMWYRNPDGAGFMFAADGKVRIEKGFMKLAEFESALDALRARYDLNALPLVLHFRITTHGGTRPENCHPFPITSSLKALQSRTSATCLGVAHNGIIPIATRKNVSDTMEYILSQLAPLREAVPDFIHSDPLKRMIKSAIQSKMCFLNADGEIVTIGDFSTDEGVLYSNLSYRTFANSRFYTYDDDFFPTTRSLSKPASTTPKVNAKHAQGSKNKPRIERKVLEWAWALPTGSYAYDTSAKMELDLDDLLIDEDGKTWKLNTELDAAEPAPHIRLYNAGGKAATLDPEYADVERVVAPPFALA